ncbi:HesA/MoeB/ThiF family protein [hydrothermal vent metagenome]|uniref:HesA/MoeB/ThiF family protein n=1 Tax=hydrothermal vent metagenome TaxID=652676 RepID=A0A1W1CMV6_9ZZZZ
MSGCARTEILIGKEGLKKLADTHVLIAGVGGVGGSCAESLCRSGIGALTLIDFDIVEPSDLNRQLVALQSTMGLNKVDVLAQRLLDINPNIKLTILNEYIDKEKALAISKNNDIDFVADCIDSIMNKVDILRFCQQNKKPFISSMGAGGRLDPTKITITKMEKTFNCALAREVRKHLRRKHASLNFSVVFSEEVIIKANPHQEVKAYKEEKSISRAVNGVISYIPNIFGMMMAGYIINELLKNKL